MASAECEVDRLLGCKCSSCGELVLEANRAQSCKKQLQCSCTFPSLVGFEEGAEVRHERVAAAEQARCDRRAPGLCLADRDPEERLTLEVDYPDLDCGSQPATVEIKRVGPFTKLVSQRAEIVQLARAPLQVAECLSDLQAFCEQLGGAFEVAFLSVQGAKVIGRDRQEPGIIDCSGQVQRLLVEEARAGASSSRPCAAMPSV